MRRFIRMTFVFFLLTIIPSAIWPLTIKLASPLPEGTNWHYGLLKMAAEWRTISQGKVRLRIYPGSIAGSEADMIRKMRFGQLDAGIFSAFGLKSMVPETFVVTLPGLIQDEEELDYILDNWIGRFDERFREEGFEIMTWSKTGWAYIFGQVPLRVPADLQRQTLAIDNTETEMAVAFKTLGFHVAPMSLGEMLVSLQSGLANSLYAPPVAAAAFQWFALAPYMTEYRVAPVVGGVVLSQRAWSRIPEEFREEIKESVVKMARSFHDESLRLNNDALRIMEENGLKKVHVTSQEIAQWEKIMRDGHLLMIGEEKSIPPAIYENLQTVLNDLRG